MSTPEKRTPLAKEFVAEHWSKILVGTLAGAAILLLIRYYRRRKLGQVTTEEERELQTLEREAVSGHQETPVLLETGLAAIELPGARELAEELAGELEGAAGSTMKTLSELRRK